MGNHGPDVLADLRQPARELRRLIPDVYDGFSKLHGAALADGVLDVKTKELIALAIAVTQRCDACIGFHIKALVRLGATREQVMETLGVCTYMGGGPALMYTAEAVRAYEEMLPANA